MKRMLVVVAVALLLPAGASARVGSHVLLVQSSDGRVVTLDVDNGRVRSIGTGATASWSPDGRSIALSRRGDLYVLSLDARHRRRLTNDELVQFAPVWSPDGSRIAYLQQRREPLGDDVVVVDLASGVATQLTTDRSLKSELEWLPGGRRLLYLRNTGALRSAVVVIDAASGGATQPLTYTPYPKWSPDGHWLAYVHQEIGERLELVVARVGGPVRILFRGAADTGVYDAVWSPNSRFLVFTYGGWSRSTSRLEVADVITGSVRALTPVHAHDSSPAWSPESRRIAFARYEASAKSYAVAIVDRRGGAARVVLRSRHFAQAVWRPVGH